MLRLRRLAIVLIAIGLITSAIYATGAFSSLSASRDANVRVAGDASGYLALQPSDGPNGAYATQQNGQLRVSLTKMADAKGGGVNPDAVTRVQNVFTITNQGPQPVGVWLTDDSDTVAFERGTSGTPFEGKGQAVTLQPGKPLTVSVAVDTREVEQGSKLQPSMTLHASTDVSSEPADGNTAGTSGGQVSDDGRTKQVDTKQKQSDGKATTTNPESSSDSMVTIAGITLHKDDATAFKDGLIYGATGMPDGARTQSTHSSPFYALAHMAVGFVPGVGDAADVRDAIQHGANGKWGEAIISGIAVAPVVGASANSVKALDFAKDWIKRFPSKGDEIASLLAKHVAPHMPDSLTVKLLDVFSGGKASELKQSGTSVDEIIDRAKKGSLSKKPKKNPNKGKRLVTDGGSKINDKQVNDINSNLGSQVEKPIDSTDIVDEHIADPQGDELVLLNTNKFKNSPKHLKKGPGFRHIVAKHVEKNNPHFKDGPFKPGSVPGGTTFPNKMDRDDIIDAIKITSKKGHIPDPKNDPAKIVYSGSELKEYGVKEMRVIRDPDSGMIITAYPTKLTS